MTFNYQQICIFCCVSSMSSENCANTIFSKVQFFLTLLFSSQKSKPDQTKYPFLTLIGERYFRLLPYFPKGRHSGWIRIFDFGIDFIPFQKPLPGLAPALWSALTYDLRRLGLSLLLISRWGFLCKLSQINWTDLVFRIFMTQSDLER